MNDTRDILAGLSEHLRPYAIATDMDTRENKCRYLLELGNDWSGVVLIDLEAPGSFEDRSYTFELGDPPWRKTYP